MPQRDTLPTKEKILEILRLKGPSLPVRIAREINTDGLFASAFLSELISNKKVKISNMRVGNSPLYFLPGQEDQLENFSEHIKGREREAFDLLKEKSFLKDDEQHPAIRVALRSIRDFAIPFRDSEENIIWRFFKVSQEDFGRVVEEKKSEKDLGIFEGRGDMEEEIPKKVEKPKIIDGPKVKKSVKKKVSTKSDKFFNIVKEFLEKRNMGIVGIEGMSKTDLILKIKSGGEEKTLVAFNKKRINDADLIKAYKKASEYKRKFLVLSKGGALKKLEELIEAAKGLESLEKIE